MLSLFHPLFYPPSLPSSLLSPLSSQVERNLKHVNQLEFDSNSPKKEDNRLCLYRGLCNDMMPNNPVMQSWEPAISGMEKAHTSEPVISTVLHSREQCLSQLPDDVTNVVSRKEEDKMLGSQDPEIFYLSGILSEGSQSVVETGPRRKKLAAGQGTSPPSIQSGSSPPQSVSTAHSLSPSPTPQPGSVGSLQPSSVFAHAPSSSSESSPHSIPSLAPSLSSTPPPMRSPDAGTDCPTSVTSETGSVGNGTTNTASAGGSPSSQGRSSEVTYTGGQTPFQTTVAECQFPPNSPDFQSASADPSPPTFSPDSVFTPAAPSHTFLPQNTTIPSSFQFGTQQQQQQQHQQQHQGHEQYQQYLQQPSPFGGITEDDVDFLLQDLTSQPPPPPPPPPQQQQQQQQWLLQHQLQQQIQQQQLALQQLLQKQQFLQQLLNQQTQLPDKYSSLSSISSSSYTPQSYGSAGPSPLPPQPNNAYQNGLIHTTDNSMQQNLSIAGSFTDYTFC